jgi:hypothetical protein
MPEHQGAPPGQDTPDPPVKAPFVSSGRSRATATQSAAVSGSIDTARRDPSARRSSAAATSGSFPASASLDRTSAQLTTLKAAPFPIASMTTEAPSSAWRTAIRAEASRTDAGPLSATAASANRRLATLSRCFRPAVSDQLVDQAAIRRNISKQASHPLCCGVAPFDLGLGELGHVGHVRMVSADHDPTTVAAKARLPLAICALERPMLCLQGGDLLLGSVALVLRKHCLPENVLDFRGMLHRETTWQT